MTTKPGTKLNSTLFNGRPGRADNLLTARGGDCVYARHEHATPNNCSLPVESLKLSCTSSSVFDFFPPAAKPPPRK